MARSSARKRRRLQDEARSATAVSGPSSASLSNGQSDGVSTAPTSPPPPPPPEPAPIKEPPTQPFYEPLNSLPNDAASLAALLREAGAAVSGGPARLADPRRTLLLLRHCAPRLSAAQLTERLTAWCQFMAGALRSPRHAWCRDAVCRTAARLLVEAARLQEAHRQLAAGGLTQLLGPLLESAELATPASLHCLRVILLHFGRGCGPARGQLARHLLRLFDCARPGVSWAACRCVALLPRAGPSGAGGAVHAAAWSGQVLGLVRSAHEHLDRLLDGLAEVQTFDVPEEPADGALALPALEELEPIELRYRLARRVSALCQVLALMLSSASQQPVRVPVTALLELAQRCVAAGAAAASAAMELQAARRALDGVRAAALRMIEALVSCCGASLMMRGSLLNRLLLSALQPAGAPQTSPAADAAHCQALGALRAWLLSVGAGCGLHEQAEQLVTTLSEDVRPPQPVKVTLQTNPATNGTAAPAPSKKRRRPAADWLEAESAGRQCAPARGRPRRCQVTLETLAQLVTALGPLLKVSVHKSLQSLCVSLLLEIQQPAIPPAPYGRPACRAGLYRLLRALVADPHPSWPAPVQFAVRLFAHGARDTDMTVAALCQDGLAVCSRVVQPTHPALFFPADLTAHGRPPPADGHGAAPDGGAAGPGAAGDPDAADSAAAAAAAVSRSSSDAGGVRSDVSECGSSDTARLDSGAGTPAAGPSAASDSASTAAGESSPAEQKPPPPWPAAAADAADGGVTTVTIASSESSASADGRRSVELAEMDEDQRSIVLGGSDDERPAAADEDEDEVEILETKRLRQDVPDDQLAPDVADMLKDFVNEDPEVE